MKWISILTSLLMIFVMESCNGQDTIPKSIRLPESLQTKINTALFIDNGPMIDSNLQKPEFLVNSYAFYPKLKKIAYAKSFVHKMSSSGIGRLYYDEIKGVDYDSFEIINADYAFAKDKNDYYLMGEPLNIQPNNQKILIDDFYRNIRIVSADSTILLRPGVNKVYKYIGYMPIGDVVYQKNDSLFLFNGKEMKHIKNPIFDASSLKQIDVKLYQDHKNLYWIDETKTFTYKAEQIVDKYTFKNIHNRANGKKTLYVGTRNFYIGNGGLFNYKLQNYHFFKESKFYVYNSCLYFMDNFSFFPIGVSSGSGMEEDEFENGLNDPKAIQVDYTKAKILTNDILVYDNKKLFKQKEEILVDPKINLANLKYAGILPDDLEKMVEKQFERQYFFYKDLFEYNRDYYVIYRDSLTKVTAYKTNLKSFKQLNEYYYTYKSTLFGHENFNHFNYNDPKLKLTDKAITFSKLQAFGMYITDGTDIWYKSIKTDKTLNEIKITPSLNLRAFSVLQSIKTLNREIPNIAFGKLKEIENTEFITDGTYLIFRGNVIGKIDIKTLKVLGKNYVEDASQYFFEYYSISKKDLKN